MLRALHVLFRRDPSRDRKEQQIHYEGYKVLWPDRRPVAFGVDAFCKHGQRLLGLGRYLEGRHERLLEMLCFPLSGRDDALTRLPGVRVRRFYLERRGQQGRIHFLDGTPTAVVFDLDGDEARVVHWIGLTALADGETQWCDLAARPLGDDVPRQPGFDMQVFPQNSIR
jgi:hypothetical protein